MSKNEKSTAPGNAGRVLHQLEEKHYFMTSRAAQPGQGMYMPGICRVRLEVA